MKGIKWLTLSILTCYLLSCDGLNNKNGEESYYYFPGKNMYYDVDRELYFFSLDSGKTWDSVIMGSTTIPSVLGEKKAISNNTEPVWANNQRDREQYNGKLYNIINDETLKPAQTDNRPVTSSSSSTQSSSEDGKKKRPIKKFFEKLFGKKKREGQ